MSLSEFERQRSGDAYWWALLISGIVAVLIGIFLVFWPAKTTLFLIQIVAIFLFIEGILGVFSALAHRQGNWGWRLVGGILGIVIGLIIFFNPVVGAVLTIGIQYYLLGIIAICMGFITVIGGRELGETSSYRWSWGNFILGLALVLIGLFFITHPTFGLYLLALCVAALAILGGVGMLLFCYQMKQPGRMMV